MLAYGVSRNSPGVKNYPPSCACYRAAVVKAKTKGKAAKATAKAKKLPAKVSKPARPTKPSLPLPPPPPAPPPRRDELDAPRDVGRLIRYGERFGQWRIDVR